MPLFFESTVYKYCTMLFLLSFFSSGESKTSDYTDGELSLAIRNVSKLCLLKV